MEKGNSSNIRNAVLGGGKDTPAWGILTPTPSHCLMIYQFHWVLSNKTVIIYTVKYN